MLLCFTPLISLKKEFDPKKAKVEQIFALTLVLSCGSGNEQVMRALACVIINICNAKNCSIKDVCLKESVIWNVTYAHEYIDIMMRTIVYATAIEIARCVVEGRPIVNPVGEAKYFCLAGQYADWMNTATFVKQIDKFVFYK